MSAMRMAPTSSAMARGTTENHGRAEDQRLFPQHLSGCTLYGRDSKKMDVAEIFLAV